LGINFSVFFVLLNLDLVETKRVFTKVINNIIDDFAFSGFVISDLAFSGLVISDLAFSGFVISDLAFSGFVFSDLAFSS